MTRRIARTLKACFTHVMSLKVGYYNTVLFCSDSPLDCRNLQGLPSALGDVADTFRDRLNPERTVAQKGSGGILVDDRAESEFITHAMGIRYIMKEYFRCM